MSQLHEECGVFGLYRTAPSPDTAAFAYQALYALQHRGQESAGIALNDDGVITCHKDVGWSARSFPPRSSPEWGRAPWPWATCATPPPA